MKHVVILEDFVLNTLLSKEMHELLTASCELIPCPSGAQGIEIPVNTPAQAAIITHLWRFSEEVMNQVPGLLVIGRIGIGIDNIAMQAATERGIVVVYTPDGPTVATAEHTVSLLLALAKRHRPAMRQMATGASPYVEPQPMEVEGKVLGIAGFGRVGSRVVRICREGLGMRVLAYSPHLTAARAAAEGIGFCPTLADLLPAADFVSLHLPANDQTRHIINAETLALMKPAAFLINCSRGGLVDEAALIAALQTGRLAGAGLDVFDPEPPAPSNPLLAMENVIATPHTAGFTAASANRMIEGAVRETLDALNGRRPDNFANAQVWDSPARLQLLASTAATRPMAAV
jgi:D-3-phosphoglycerate dehydrogenase / 2-oxoglutarate reductase